MINFQILHKIKQSTWELQTMGEKQRNKFLQYLAISLWESRQEIYSANIKDVAKARLNKLSAAFITRLILDGEKLKNIIMRLKNLQKIDNDAGKIIEEKVLDNGVILQKKKVPFGVIFVIFESRPEVMIDATALCIKSGNAVILKAGKDAKYTNKILFSCIMRALKKSGISDNAVYYLDNIKREDIYTLIKQKDDIDLVIARGGYEMVKSICEKSKIPVLSHSAGGARIYIDEGADLEIAKKVIINAKTSSPATCNSLDTIVVHRNIATGFISQIVSELKRLDVKIYGDKATGKIVQILSATGKIWEKEFLGLEIAIKIVSSADEAINFIKNYSNKHTEGIIATNNEVIDKFTKAIDAASIMINCSTRLHDGGIYGLGTELGIATGKFHARGPVGLKELTTYKWIAIGKGQIRH